MSPALDGWRKALGLTGVVVALDQAMKAIAAASLQPGERFGLALGVDLTHVHNRGVAFGLFADGRTGVILITVAATAVMVAYFARHPARPGMWVAVGLLVGGALGNLADRVRIDAVIDYVNPPFWPAFNFADVSIVAGVLVLLVTLERSGGDAEADREPRPA